MIFAPITSISALLSGVIILLLTIKVIQLRRNGGVVLGDNDNRPLTKAIRGHANATEQVPIALILMGLAELQGGNTILLVLGAACLIVGRTLHGIYFAHDGTHWRLRMIGMALTLLAQIILLVALLLALIS
ncbi:MAPEG family protein [Yoonia sp. GPGPB17]|uniref:MAPEG family protein n=1 Tax=Yoonia sp. GPGPB17 TaxID=3026147 RepID=UPI0030C65263